jgi:Adenylate kinase and related kinases
VVGRLVKRAVDQGRTDDSEDVIRRRLEVYPEQTAPLLTTYSDRGLLVQVDGMGVVEDVTSRLLAVVVVD